MKIIELIPSPQRSATIRAIMLNDAQSSRSTAAAAANNFYRILRGEPPTPLPFPVSLETPAVQLKTFIPVDQPFGDSRGRFEKLPKPSIESETEQGWPMVDLLERMIPHDATSGMLWQPFMGFLEYMARNFYQEHRQRYPKRNERYKGHRQPYFAEISESCALGVTVDKLYRHIGNELGIVSQIKDASLQKKKDITGLGSQFYTAIQQQLDRYSSQILQTNNGMDLDITLLSYKKNVSNPNFILDQWQRYREKEGFLDYKVRYRGGKRIITGRNIHLVEEDKLANGSTIFRGWRVVKQLAADSFPVISIQAGRFASYEELLPYKEESLRMVEPVFSIDLTARPVRWTQEYSQAHRRKGNMVSFADDALRLELKSRSLRNINLIATMPKHTFHLWKHGREKFYLFQNTNLFRDRRRVIPMVIRGLKSMATRVNLFDIPQKFAEGAENAISPNLWNTVGVENWNNELIFSFLASGHLSPITVGAMLIPNEKLKNVPSVLTGKLARNGIDYSLSLGNLWPVFSEMSVEQVFKFLLNLPEQDTYVENYLKNPERLENQGFYHIISSLRKAGIFIPHFDGNILLQTLFVFRHLDDYRLLALAQLDEIAEIVGHLDLEKSNYLTLEMLTRKRDRLTELLEKTELPGDTKFLEELNRIITAMRQKVAKEEANVVYQN